MAEETKTEFSVNLKILTPKPIFVFLTYDGHGLPVAYRLLQEGYSVYVGQAENVSELKEEKEEVKERRLKLYDGILEKIPIERLINSLLKVKNKERYFIFADFNMLYEYAEPLLRAGFRGLLPTKEDYLLEENREMAKEFVDKNYPSITPKEHHQFSKIEEAIQFLEETDKVWVLKGFYTDAPTIVPIYDNPEIAKEEIISALREYQKEYEKEGFILEEKLSEILEFVPEAIAFNGKLVGVNVCLELKDFYPSPRGKGGQTGCTASSIFWLPIQDIEGIYNAFLKPLEERMLRKNLMTIWDCGILYDKKTKKFYFTEFCPNRPGYNSFFDELATFPSVGEYFERLLREEYLFNPISTHTFGASFRVFNNVIELLTTKPSEIILLNEYGEKTNQVDKDIWLWDVQKKGNHYYAANYDRNLAIVSGSANDFKRAFDNAWEKTSQIIMDNAYFVNLEDIFSTSYKNNLIERYLFVRGEFTLENLPIVI